MPTRAQLEKARARRAMSAKMKESVAEAKKGQERAARAKPQKAKVPAGGDKYSQAAARSKAKRAAAKARSTSRGSRSRARTGGPMSTSGGSKTMQGGNKPIAKRSGSSASRTGPQRARGYRQEKVVKGETIREQAKQIKGGASKPTSSSRGSAGKMVGRAAARVLGPVGAGVAAGSILAPIAMGDKPKMKTEGGMGRGRNKTAPERRMRRKTQKAKAGMAAPAPTAKPAAAKPAAAPSTAAKPKVSKPAASKPKPMQRKGATVQEGPSRPIVKAKTKDKGFNLGNLSIKRDGWTEDDAYGVPVAKYSVRMAQGGMVKNPTQPVQSARAQSNPLMKQTRQRAMGMKKGGMMKKGCKK